MLTAAGPTVDYMIVVAVPTQDPDILIAKHMAFARKLAFRLARTLPPAADVDALESDAMLGLVQAARTFDPGRGASFATYAYLRISGAMLDGLRERHYLRQGDAPLAVVSLSKPVCRDEDGRPATLGDVLPTREEPVGAEAETRETIAAMLRRAGPRDAKDLEDHYLHGIPQKDIAARRGLSPSRISQRFKAARLRLQRLNGHG